MPAFALFIWEARETERAGSREKFANFREPRTFNLRLSWSIWFFAHLPPPPANKKFHRPTSSSQNKLFPTTETDDIGGFLFYSFAPLSLIVITFKMRPNSQDPLLLQDPTYAHVRDVLKQMRRGEATSYRRPLSKPIEPFNGVWRQQIIEWMYTLVKYCKLRHEAAAAGAYFLDTAVARGVIKTPSDYQLGAMTSLYLGLKVFDSPSMRVVRLSSLVKLGNAEFTENDIIQMERDMVKAMGWRLNPPTPNCFLQQYLVLLPTLNESTKTQIEEKALEALEIAVANERFYSMKPSVLGCAALLVALDRYLEAQKRTIPGCGAEMISLWQLRTFLYNMKHIAKLDHTSVLISQTTSMLERALKPLATTNASEPATVSNNSSKDSTYMFESRGSNGASSSPTNVAFQ